MMRLLITADAVGGIFSHALELARALTRRGACVTLAVLGPALDAVQRSNVGEIDGLELEEHGGALEWMDDPWRDVDDANRWLSSLARRVRADIVHLNGFSQALAEFTVPRVVGAHSSVHGWWRAVYGEAAPTRYDEYGRRVRAGIARADLVVAPTRAMLDSLERDQSCRARASRVIANGIDLQRWAPREKAPYFAAAGRLWDRSKNLSLIAEIAKDLPWPVRVAGEGATDAPRSPRLELLGPVPRELLAQLFAAASVFLHPACYEPFGLAPLEAACSGCALVLGDIPSLREVWGDAALYASPRDESGVRELAQRLADDAELRNELGARARRRAALYSSEFMAENYLGVYRRLAPWAAPNWSASGGSALGALT
jgi:glycosyltransferase involved in cell wall biosynthesis